MKRRRPYRGCAIEAPKGRWRVRFRWRGRRYARTTTLAATAENRAQVDKLAALIGATIAAGKNPLALFKTAAGSKSAAPKSETVRAYYERWIADKVPPMTRKALALDYRRHLEGYVLPRLGPIPIDRLTPRDIVALQAELLSRPLTEHARRRLPGHQRGEGVGTASEPRTLSVKTVRNILLGSFGALLRDAAHIDEIPIKPNLFSGVQWPRGIVPGPEPYEPAERDRILAWFKGKRFGLHAGRPGATNRTRLHPPYHAFLHTLFWTGMRPSEAAGLHWEDIDLNAATVRILRSRHLGQERATKTPAAARIVELLPHTVEILRTIQPLNVVPNTPVFTNLEGRPIEPKALSTHWYHCLRALGLPIRGLYATKDTYVSLAMSRGVDPVWLQEQTGVRFETLRRHYGRWMRSEGADQLRKLGQLAPKLAPNKLGPLQLFNSIEGDECEEGDLNPHGFYPTRPST